MVLKSLANIDIKIDKRKETCDMCKAWTDWRESGVREGRKEGRKEGFSRGLSKGIKQGRRDGISMGEAKTLVQMILGMHDNGIDIPMIATVSKKPEAEVSNIISTRGKCILAHV